MSVLPLRLVLLRPRNPENLGAVARAMKNFDVGDWAIVDPRTLDFAAARRVAVHAEEILDKPKMVSTLGEAVADCTWVVGTSSRRLEGKRRLTPAQVAREMIDRAAAGGRTALVFGDERSGMSNEEIERCHDLSFIPTGPEQPSLNLAQALVIYCHEAFQASLAERPAAPRPAEASDGQLSLIGEALEHLLRAGGFLVGDGRHAVKDMMAALRRARLSQREARLWLAALKRAGRGRGED